MKNQVCSAVLVMALLHVCEGQLRRKRNAVLAIDDLEKSTILDDLDAWGRGLKTKKGKEAHQDASAEDTSEEDSLDTGKKGKSDKKAKSGKKSKRYKRGTKKGKKVIDSFMEELNSAMSFSMSMSMPSGTPAPAPAPAQPTPAPAVTTPPPQMLTPAPVLSPTQAPTLSPFTTCSALPRDEALESILVQITDGPILINPATPQGQAYRWLLNDDPLQIDPCTYPTVEQRYALATFFFSTGGDNWIVNSAWMSVAGECDWFGITCADGQATAIEMGTLHTYSHAFTERSVYPSHPC